jgi:hypothetical protein
MTAPIPKLNTQVEIVDSCRCVCCPILSRSPKKTPTPAIQAEALKAAGVGVSTLGATSAPIPKLTSKASFFELMLKRAK